MAFKKVEKNVINYQPPSNDSLRLVSGNTALVTVISQTVPLSGVTNIGLGPGYFYSSTVNRIAEFRGISGDTNITINYVESGDTVGVNLNDNIIVNSISATTYYSGSTPLSQLLTGGTGSFTQQYVSGSTGSQSLISIAPAGVNNVAGANSVVLSNSSSGFSEHSGILAGKNNTINTGADYSLASGLNNIISAPYSGPTFSRIEGKDNIINNTYTTVSGTLNSGLTSHSWIRGKQNYAIGNYFGIFQLLYNCYGLNQINGAANRTVNAGVNNIHNGFSNHIFNGNYNSILNGTENRLYNSSLALINGSSNKSYSVNYSTIIGTNNITTTANTASAQFNSIIGATQSRIEDSDKSSILGGQLNRITGVTPGFNVIVNGDGGKIHGSRSTVINGFNSFILDSSDNCTIIGGGDNVINHGQDSIIFNGRLNTVNASTGVTLINVSNQTTSSADENVLITNKIRAISLTGGGTQMVVADTTGFLSVQAIPSGGSSSQLYVSGSTGTGSLISIAPASVSSAAGNYAVALGKNNQADTISSGILAGENNYILGSGRVSGIVAGKNNTINSSYAYDCGNIINGGILNKITGQTRSSNISSSYSSIITSSKYSSIINSNNSNINIYGITPSTHQLISNASYSSSAGFKNSILGGTNIYISGTSGVILNGNQNEISLAQNAFIANGASNEIFDVGSQFATVLNGFHNHIRTSGKYSTIANGKYNTIYSPNSTILSSSYSRLSSIASGSSIISLSNFTGTSANTLFTNSIQARSLTGATTRMVVANTSGALSTQAIPPTYTQYWTVGGVYSSLIQNNGTNTTNSDYSIVAGKLNSIGTNSNYSNILGGIENQNIDNNKYSAIVNGIQNQIKDYSNHAFIGTGRGGYIYNSNNSSILNGYGNRIYNSASNSESKYNTILGGYQNKIIRATHSTVLGGFLSSIGTGDALYQYSCVFGKQNYVNANYSAIIGGQGYSLTENNTLLTPKLKIGNLPSTSSTYLLNANSYGNVYKIGMSGGTGININNTDGLLTITYTGSTSSGGGATVNNGLNTYTAGTSTFQSVNVSGLTIDNINVSGSSTFNSLSASSVQISNLVSTGNTKMVVADINGNLSANTIPFNILNYKQSTLPSNGAKRYYRTSPILGGIANGTFAQHSIVLAPFYIGKNCDINELQLQVTTTGGTGVYSLAIYDNYTPGGLHPGNLKQSFGSGLTSPTGVKVLTASTVTYYEAGMYWLALWNSTSFAISVSSNNNIDIGTTNSNFTNTSTFVSAATWSNSFPANMTGVTSTGTVTPLLNYHMKTIYN